MALFDTGASHSFISATCALTLGLESEPLRIAMRIVLPLGSQTRVDRECRSCELEIGNVRLSWDLQVMEMTDFDVILGMYWLTTHRATLDCHKKTVVAFTLEGLKLCYRKNKEEMLYPFVRKTRKWNELVGRIAVLTLNEDDGSSLELPRVVNEFADVFPEELPGLPPR